MGEQVTIASPQHYSAAEPWNRSEEKTANHMRNRTRKQDRVTSYSEAYIIAMERGQARARPQASPCTSASKPTYNRALFSYINKSKINSVWKPIKNHRKIHIKRLVRTRQRRRRQRLTRQFPRRRHSQRRRRQRLTRQSPRRRRRRISE